MVAVFFVCIKKVLFIYQKKYFLSKKLLSSFFNVD